MKEAGGDPTRILEVDILRGGSHDTLKDDGVYATLMRMALDGMVEGVLGGPNCRARSELRHVPRIGFPGPARPTACPFGLPNLSEAEQEKVFGDDVLLFRMLTLYIVAEMARSGGGKQEEPVVKKPLVAFLLEQPARPEREPECASFWRTPEWSQLGYYYDLEEYSISCRVIGVVLQEANDVWNFA